MHLFGLNRDHDYYFELPVKGSGIPNQLLSVVPHTIAMSGLSRVRTELRHLLIVPSFAPHPVQTKFALGYINSRNFYPQSRRANLTLLLQFQ